jgi:hypothetical protein
LGIASSKISSYKSESIEVLNSFKKLSAKYKNYISSKDLFEFDYRG